MTGAAPVKHLDLETLWVLSKHPFKPDQADFQHLMACEECTATLGLCLLFDTIEEVKERLARAASENRRR
jgi:hypothetical protein